MAGRTGKAKAKAGPAPIIARHWSSGMMVRVRSADGRIIEIEPIEGRNDPEWWVAPPLVDVQVNGFGGVDYQADTVDAAALVGSIQLLRRAGCLRMLLTLVTDEWGRLLARLERLRQIREQSAVLRSAIAGWHIEGPFLSAAPGFCGAHDSERMLDPSPDRMRALRAAAGDDPLLVTLAPEREGALESIRTAVGLGMRVSLGHTDASAAVLAEAVAAGASGFTHLGNGCPQALDRADNILWRVLERSDLMVSLIPDGWHVSPALFRLLHRLLPADRLIYTSDAMAAAGLGPGRYRLGRIEVDVGADQAVRQPGRTNFAGSALRPADGVGRAAAMLGEGWQQVWRRWSLAPAEWLGLPCGLACGMLADFCLVQVSPDNRITAVRPFLGGTEADAT
jgi:N-acetylglucosamine-6-phosphate deacetylase